MSDPKNPNKDTEKETEDATATSLWLATGGPVILLPIASLLELIKTTNLVEAKLLLKLLRGVSLPSVVSLALREMADDKTRWYKVNREELSAALQLLTAQQ